MKARIVLFLFVLAVLLTACGGGGTEKPAGGETKPTQGVIVNPDFAGTWSVADAKERFHIFYPPEGIKLEAWSYETGEQFVISDVKYDEKTLTVTIERPSLGTKETSTFVPRDGKLIETRQSNPGVEIEWAKDW